MLMPVLAWVRRNKKAGDFYKAADINGFLHNRRGFYNIRRLLIKHILRLAKPAFRNSVSIRHLSSYRIRSVSAISACTKYSKI